MGLPNETDNYEGYVNAQLINKYEGIRDKDYFLIHGTLDDNVHYQQSMLWSKILEQKDILFRQQVNIQLTVVICEHFFASCYSSTILSETFDG